MTADLDREGPTTTPVAEAEGTHRVHLPHLSPFKPSKLVMPFLTAFGLWLTAGHLRGLGEPCATFDL